MLLAALLLSTGPVLAPTALDKPAQDQTHRVDTKRIEAAVDELTAAFKEGKTPEERVAAIKKNREVIEAKVVSAIEKGLKDKSPEVQAATVDALGRMPHPDALEALHKFFKSDKQRLKDDEKLLPLLFKSIGRHGSEKSVEILSGDPFLQRSFPAIQARVMSLGNIRSKKSVEAILDMMNKAGVVEVNDYQLLFRQALLRLTGTDRGPDSALWQKWWQDNKTKFEVQKEVPKVPELAEKLWNEYWEITP
jgi:HEAT repeat protein